MYNTINDLFFGVLNPWGDNSTDSEYDEAQRIYDKLYEKIMERLGDRELQERFDYAFADLANAGERIMFCRGFRLGMKLAAESFLNA